MSIGLPIKVTAETVILPPDESKTLGQKIPRTLFFNEQGKNIYLDDFLGKPIVISPIFTQCTYTCPIITQSLKDVILQIPDFEKKYQVMSVSFDVSDTPTTLKAFKEKEKLPSFWEVVGATKENLFPFLNALDFKFMSLEGGGFAHPNLIVVLDSEHRVSSYLYGTTYSVKKLKKALNKVLGKGAWETGETFKSYIFFISISGFIVALTFLVFRITKTQH